MNKPNKDATAVKKTFAPIRPRNWLSALIFILAFVINLISVFLQTRLPNPRIFDNMYNAGVDSVGIWVCVVFFSVFLITAPVSGLITLFVKWLTKEISWAIFLRTLSVVQLILVSPSLVNLVLLLFTGNLTLR